MSGTLIAIGVVCLAIGIVTNLVVAETDKPATGGPISPSRAVRKLLGQAHDAQEGDVTDMPAGSSPVAVLDEPLAVPDELPAGSDAPVLVEPEPVLVEPEPVLVEPEPVLVEPEPVLVEPEPRPAPRGEPVVPLRWWQRARSASLLLTLLVALGLVAAAVIGGLAVLLVQLVRDAVG